MKNFNSFFNQLTAMPKRLAMVLTMLLIVGIGQAWGAEYTITFKSASSDSSSDLGTSPNVSNVVSSGTSYVASFSGCSKMYVGKSGIKLGSNSATGTMNFTLATNYQSNIKSIKVVSAKYGSDTGTLTLYNGNTSLKSGISPGTDYTHTFSSPTKATSLKLATSSKRAYITKIVITTEETATCTTPPTVTAASNSNITSTTVTVSCSDGITSLGSAGCSITSYGFVYGTSSNPTISNTKVQVGTTYATTGTAFSKELTGLTANTTYYVRPYATNGYGTDYGTQTSFKTLELPKYIVTLKDDNSTRTQESAGGSVDLPSRDGCGGYTFAGWTNSWNAHQTSWITTAPTIIPAGSYTPTADENLYPVYTKTEGGTPVPATLTASYSSHSGWTATGCGGSSYWVLKQNASITSPVISDLSTVTSITFNVRTYGGSSYNTVNVSTSGGTSIGSATASNTTLTLKTINVSPKLSGSGSIVFSSTTTSSSNGPGINEITINYSTGGSTTYYISVPDCATQTVVTLSQQGGTGGTESVTATNGQPMPTITPPTLAGYDFQGYFTATSDGTKYYNADGTSARDWDKEDATFTLYAYWKTKTYTVTLDNQGATTEGATSVTATYNAAMPSIASNLPQKTGYTFNGYFDAASGGTQYYKADGTSAKNWDKTANTTLYAQWTSNKTATTLYWSAATYSATIDVDNTFPTLTILPNDLTGVTYSSSNTSVAMIDANTGEITLKAAGTTTITATFTETATHTGATDSYTLTVNPSNCKWVETNIIEHGDEVVITMTGTNGVTYTFENTKNTNSAPDAVKVDNISGTYITSVADGIKWVVNKDGDELTFKSYLSDNYLYCTDNNNGVRVGNTSSSQIFTIDNESGYLKHTVTNRYLGVYNNQDWRCYTDKDNFAGQTLKFYKKECLDSETFWVDYNLANVTCTTAPPPFANC